MVSVSGKIFSVSIVYDFCLVFPLFVHSICAVRLVMCFAVCWCVIVLIICLSAYVKMKLVMFVGMNQSLEADISFHSHALSYYYQYGVLWCVLTAE